MANLKDNLLVQTFQAGGWVYPKDNPHKHKNSIYRAYEALQIEGLVERDWDSSVIRYRTTEKAKRKLLNF
jgi:hypothetical protein